MTKKKTQISRAIKSHTAWGLKKNKTEFGKRGERDNNNRNGKSQTESCIVKFERGRGEEVRERWLERGDKGGGVSKVEGQTAGTKNAFGTTQNAHRESRILPLPAKTA